MMYFLIVISIVYALLVSYLLYGFQQVKEFVSEEKPVKTSFSIIIAFRNEANNLPQLFSTLKKLIYPTHLFEIMLVNDGSTDNSEAISTEFKNANPQLHISILNNQLSELAKKGAIKTGINSAEKEFIITTDADCEVPENWLMEFDSFIQETGAKFVSGPVVFKKDKGLLNIFQSIDFMSLQGATIGGFGIDKAFMCNGANLCYCKSAFIDLNGFSGNEKIASGDDIFLLEKMQSDGFKTAYLKSEKAIVSTKPQPTFKKLINQRVRWAAKTSVYENRFSKFVGLIIFLMNFSLIIGLVGVFTHLIPQRYFFYIFLIKFNVDFLLIYKTAAFFQNQKILNNYFWCSFLYPFFTCFIALKSLLYGYSWKDRQFRR